MHWGCTIKQLDLQLGVNWEVGDVALCITPGSLMEGKEVTILTPAYPVPYKPDLIHQVDPASLLAAATLAGVPRGATYGRYRIRINQARGIAVFSSRENW